VAEVTNKTAPAVNLTDELFSTKQSSSCHLSVQAGLDGFSFCILDTKTNKFLVLQHFPFNGIATFNRLSEKIAGIISESELLKNNFKSVSCSVVHAKSTLVPNALFDENQKNDFLSFNFTLDADEEVRANNLRNLDAKNLFAVNLNLENTLKKFFPNVQFIHHSTSLLESTMGTFKNQPGKKMVVHVGRSQFEIAIAEGKQLLFYNSFRHQSSEDFIYYVLFVCEQLQLNPEKVDLILLGEIERSSALYEILHKYVRHIHFGERSENFEYAYKLETIPKHFYHNLFSQYLCVS